MTTKQSPVAVGVTSRNAAFITELQARNSVLVEENRQLKAALAAAPASPFDAANSRVAEYHQLKEAYVALEVERDALQKAHDAQMDRAAKTSKAWLESEDMVASLRRELRENRAEMAAAEEALKFYADRDNYDMGPARDGSVDTLTSIEDDGGERARAALSASHRQNNANLQNFANCGFAAASALPDGVPCSHPGCLSHVSHPCEGCGRIAGRAVGRLTS